MRNNLNSYIKKCIFAIIALALCVFGVSQFSPEVEHTQSKKPNIILLTINVLRADHVSLYGYPRTTTPALDELAKNSSVFLNAFANAGYTMPSMMSIFTSLYPDSHQVYDAFKDELSTKILTLAEILNIHDYTTGWFATLHLPHLLPKAGFNRGFTFKSNIGIQLEGKEHLFDWLNDERDNPFFLAMNVRHAHSPYLPLPKYRHAFAKGVKRLPIETYDDFTKTVYEKFIHKVQNKEDPLFQIIDPREMASRKELFTGGYQREKLQKIESLIKPADHHRMGGFQMDTYYETVDYNNDDNVQAMISYYDACLLGVDQEIIQPLMAILKKRDIFDDTMIIVMGDHGETFGEHGTWGHSARLDFYDQPLHVPLIIKMPMPRQKRRDIVTLVQSIDILPTILDVAEIGHPHTAQGKSILPVLKKPGATLNDYIFGENRHFAYIRSKNWKLIVKRRPQKSDTLYCETDRFFDLKNDPGESQDVKEREREAYENMKKKLLEHLQNLPVYVDRKYEFYPHIQETTREKIKQTGYW